MLMSRLLLPHFSPCLMISCEGAGENLLEVIIDNEEKDLWHAFLQKGNHAMAARYANTQVMPHLQRADKGALELAA